MYCHEEATSKCYDDMTSVIPKTKTLVSVWNDWRCSKRELKECEKKERFKMILLNFDKNIIR
jgi:hypothetical protein